jgi:predicted RNase H-like nuclease (RuvC/YqgF family)
VTETDISQILRALGDLERKIVKLETKIESLERRLEHGDHQFDVMERRLDILDQHNSRVLGGLAVLVIIVPILVRWFMP